MVGHSLGEDKENSLSAFGGKETGTGKRTKRLSFSVRKKEKRRKTEHRLKKGGIDY